MEPSGSQSIVNLKIIRSFKPVKIPKIPSYFVDTNSLMPQSGMLGEGIAMIDKVARGTRFGIGSKASNSTFLLTFSEIDVETLRIVIISPNFGTKLPNTCLQIKGSQVLSLNLPGLTDSVLHPKEAKVYFYWLMASCSGDDIWECISLLMRETAPMLPVKMETYILKDGINSVDVRSFSNYFKAFDVNTTAFDGIDITWSTKSTTTDDRDGRTTKVTIVGNKNQKYYECGMVKDATHMNFIIWNCRGMAHTLFQKILDYLVDLYWPDFVLLLETRVCRVLCERIVEDFEFETVRASEPCLGGGGVAMLGKGTWPKISKLEPRDESGFGLKITWS